MNKVLVLLANGCEELEAITIIDLLRRATIDVTSASLDHGSKVSAIKASRGVVITPDITIDDALKQTYDMVVLPGGLPGADHLDNDVRVSAIIKKMNDEDKFIAAICAAPKVLANANLLDHKQATSYPGVLNSLSLKNTTISSENVVVDGNVTTSRGPATAMEFALSLIEQLDSVEKRNEVAKALLL